MKLNYRDRIIIGVLLALSVILIVAFLLIKPKKQEIDDNKAQLATLQASQAEVQSQIDEIPGLKTDIKNIHAEGIKFTEDFVELETFDNTRKFDQLMQKFAEENEVTITSLSVSDVGVTNLGYYYFVPPVVAENFRLQYDINGELKKEIDELRKESNALAGRSAANLMKATYTINVTAEEKENLWSYMEAMEQQKETMIIDSVTLTNIEIKEDENAQPAEGEEEMLPEATFVVSLYSVYEMPEPDTEMK